MYSHSADDQRMFRLVSAQLIQCGACRHKEIIETFGVSKSSVNRALKKLREEGAEGFFKRRAGGRSGSVLTAEVLAQAQGLLDRGYSRAELVDELGVKYDTLRKALQDGRLRETAQPAAEIATAKSSRDVVDAQAAEGLGTACTRTEERVGAAFGVGEGATVHFEPCLDVPKGGVLCALPSLLANGLLEGVEQLLGKLKGYYRTAPILLLLAFMALCRVRTVEQLRGHSPGEFGKLLGLDRVPEVRCLRRKLDELSTDGAEQWAVQLSRQWLQGDPEAAGTLYVDGHVRVYYGGQTKLPRKYVSRERLCLRGTLDYWVNDAFGRPFFVVEKAIDPGMLQTLEHDIVPRLLNDIPNQPTEQELQANPHRCRFILVFDREGYSPAFFGKLWRNHRIACLTYHKHPDDPWPVEWFSEQHVNLPGGEIVTMPLAEMGSRVGTGKHAVWMREVRKLTDSGHQTSLISTAYELPHLELAGRLFSRWCQENFFRYMRQHFALDRLAEYGTEDFPDTERVVNPTWRELDKRRISLLNKLRYRQARFTEMTLHPEAEDNQARYHKWLHKKADLLEQIQHFEHQLNAVKDQLKHTPKHITWTELKDKDKFYRLLPGRKRLMDTVRMIAYRAETAMVGLLIGPGVDSAAARRLLQDLFVTEADIFPEPENQLLRVRIHGASTPAANRALRHLFEQLNEANVLYPGTDMRLTYELGACNG